MPGAAGGLHCDQKRLRSDSTCHQGLELKSHPRLVQIYFYSLIIQKSVKISGYIGKSMRSDTTLGKKATNHWLGFSFLEVNFINTLLIMISMNKHTLFFFIFK